MLARKLEFIFVSVFVCGFFHYHFLDGAKTALYILTNS